MTNTIPLREDAAACSRIRQLSVAELIAESIRRINEEESVAACSWTEVGQSGRARRASIQQPIFQTTQQINGADHGQLRTHRLAA